MMERINQAVILCGGLGTRLGQLTAETPKPLLAIAGRPFLSILIEEIARQGVDRFLLLASFEAEQIHRFAHTLPGELGRRITIDVLVEPERAGTAGALCYAGPHLDPAFFLFNGDSWFDIPLRELRNALTAAPQQIGTLEPVPKGLSDWGTRDSKGLFRPSWSERCGPQPLAGSIVARDFDMKRI